jgi:septum formation protein
MKLPRLVLASASPRRSELLKQLGVPFEVIAANAEEISPRHLSPHEVCQVNAHRKARAVARQHTNALVLGADTVVALGTTIFGKPTDVADARRMLRALSGKTHQVITGIALMQLAAQKERLLAVSTTVVFRKLTAAQISDYVAKVHTLDKAGAYAIQEYGEMIVEQINGSFSNVVGLPLERLELELRDWQVR